MRNYLEGCYRRLMPVTKSTPASEAWRALLVAFTGINNELAAEMDDGFGVAMEDYEVLLMLYEAGRDGLRPSEIAANRRLSRSGATRLVDRLERDGLVERLDCGADGRGSVVSLSRQGRRTFPEVGRLHLNGIERHVGSRLSVSEAAELRRLLDKLIGD